jgi:hypothetical protein
LVCCFRCFRCFPRFSNCHAVKVEAGWWADEGWSAIEGRKMFHSLLWGKILKAKKPAGQRRSTYLYKYMIHKGHTSSWQKKDYKAFSERRTDREECKKEPRNSQMRKSLSNYCLKFFSWKIQNV